MNHTGFCPQVRTPSTSGQRISIHTATMVTSLLGVDVALFLVIGLLGGAHCIGMCGPLVTIYASKMNPARSDGGHARQDRGTHLTTYEVRQHALFNVGRTVSYTAIGALMGTLGGLLFVGVDQVSAAAELVRGVVGVGIGAFVIVVGGYYTLGRISMGIQLPGTQAVTRWLTTHVERLASGPGIVGLGALHGLLPCPILYPAYLYAFASGSPVTGGIALAALGVGTIPAVFVYGTLIESVDAVHRRRLHRLLGIAFLALGYVLFAHGLMALGIHIPHPRLPFWDPLEMSVVGQ
jgi:sulfite exporter TauE/SafE